AVGYAGSYTVTGHGGTLTWLPAAGRVIGQGQVLYRVGNGTPVFLLYGRVPAWRALAAGVHGADVRQLNHALVALGCATRAQLDPASKYFTAATGYALERLQARLGLPQTGTLPLGQAVFLPSAIRVTTVPGALGAPAAGAGLAATSARHVVTIALDAAQQSEVQAGDTVAITLPDGRVTPGVVSSVGKVATGGASPKVTVTVALTHPRVAGALDQAPVTVAITTATGKHALVVPVTALLARPAGDAVGGAGPGGAAGPAWGGSVGAFPGPRRGGGGGRGGGGRRGSPWGAPRQARRPTRRPRRAAGPARRRPGRAGAGGGDQNLPQRPA